MRSQGRPWERGEDVVDKINTLSRSHAPAWERVKKYKQMRTIIKYFGVTLSLLILVSVLSCGKRTVSECQSKKIELLLEDIFKKKRYFTAFKSEIINLNHKIPTPPDSSRYFGYLISSNIKIPDKVFYLHWNKNLVPTYPDSIKLRPIKALSEMNSYAFTVGVSIIEVNADSTMMKVALEFGSGGKAHDEGVFKYSFDKINCKWTVLDSTITYY
jgi:hypothetical protein